MHPWLAWGAPTYTLLRVQWLPHPPETVFEFFRDPHNLQGITPPDIAFEVLSCEPLPMTTGSMIRYRLKTFGIRHGWLTRIADWDPPRVFTDTQERGPYIRWEHRHTFEPDGDGVTMIDRVQYRVPFGPLGVLLHWLLIRPRLEAIFDYRRRAIGERWGG